MEKATDACNKIMDAIEAKKQEMFELLQKVVNQDSFSQDKDDVNLLGEILSDWLQSHHFDLEIIPQPNHGSQIIARLKGSRPGKIVMMGHFDTVYPHGTAKERPFSFDGTRFYGPGVADMKAGVVTTLYASWIAHQFCQDRLCDIELILTTDEELASPTSKFIIEERVKDALAVFNMEPGRADGSIVTARRGSAQIAITTKGKPAHAGVAIEDGINAISEMCRKLIAIENIADMKLDTTVSLGTIQGGTFTNMVAPQASATLHFGFWKNEHYHEMFRKAQEVVDQAFISGTTAELKLLSKCFPMEKTAGTALLFGMVSQNAAKLGISLTEQATRGAADSGIPSTLGIPTICGMGPVGGHYHSEAEYVEASSFLERTKLLALSLLSASDFFTNAHQ
jgi:glutamate carboxypeptidase